MIDSFFGEYRFLSNFYSSKVRYMRWKFPTVEHAYQFAKLIDPNDYDAAAVREIEAGQAKRWGRTIEIRPDWEQSKVQVMRLLLEQKFPKDSHMADRLIATHPHELVEGNTWGDKFWGVCNGEGLNTLGNLLMTIRLELMFEETSK